MNEYLAIGILDGFEACEGPDQYIEACRFIRDHGPRGVLCGSGMRNAIELANLADQGYDAAIDAIGVHHRGRQQLPK